MRYRLELSYRGTSYHGWQRQPNAVSVQEIIEGALTKLLRSPIEIVGAGRTDTGVHARHYVAHFDANMLPYSREHLVYMLNGILPHDIAIHSILPTTPDFHSRFDAVSRTYEYWIARNKDPFLIDGAFLFSGALSLDAMQTGAALLLQYKDFASFCKSGTDASTTLCYLTESQWSVREQVWVYRVTADRFLRNMVRAMVGTLIDLGRGKITLDEFRTIIEAKDRGRAGASAPPQGLYLVEVNYAD